VGEAARERVGTCVCGGAVVRERGTYGWHLATCDDCRRVWDDWDLLYLACSLSTWEGDRTRCRVCNGPFPTKRNTRYCSPKCSEDGAGQHIWAIASKLARRRDRWACVVCGQKEGWVVKPIRHPTNVTDRETWETRPLYGMSHPGLRRLDSTGKRARLHVHHRSPVDRGLPYNGYGSGCQHHLDGLVTLCGPCHVQAHALLRGKAQAEQLAILPE
jgi:hypothetical protein